MRSKESGVKSNSDYYVYQPSAIASRIYLYPIAIGYFYYDTDYYLKRNNYDSILLMHIRSGKCTIKLNGQVYVAQKDDIVLLDCYQPHEYGNAGNDCLEIAWIHFDGVLARNYYELITATSGHVITGSGLQTIVKGMDKLLTLFRNSSSIRESFASEQLTKMLTELLNINLTQTKESQMKGNIIENSIAYINEHFNEPLTLDMMAENANLSPYYFTRVFTAGTGFTPHQYLIATRINSAKFLLQRPGLSIKEIAFSSGFNSESSFCSTFRKWEKITPGEYRERACASET